MKYYPEYESSGIDWIGEIPKHWEVERIKRIQSDLVGGIWGDEPEENGNDTYCIRVADFDYEHLTISTHNLTVRNITLNETDKRLLRTNDLLVEKSGGGEKSPVGKTVIFNAEISRQSVTSNFISKFTAKSDSCFPKYVLYCLCFFYHIGLTRKHIKQTTGIQNLDIDSYFQEKIPLPSLVEQRQIANFLDRKTEQIDALIRIKDRRIELLQEQRTALINQAVTKGLDPNVEMKPSGVEWIGEIPKHWEVKRIKYLASVISKGTTPTTIGREIFDEGEIRFIKVENIVDNQIELKPEHYIDAETNQMLKRSQLKENDLLFVIAGATIGKVSLVKLSNLPANTNQAISFIRLHEKDLPEFVYYWLQSDNIQKIIWLNTVQSAQPNLSMEDLGNLYIPYPSIAEQHRIVNHITDKRQTIIQLLQQAYKQIELLKEYRQSLISEAVTGKIDVRNEV